MAKASPALGAGAIGDDHRTQLSSRKIRQDLSGTAARARASTSLSMSCFERASKNRLILSGACPGESRGRRMTGTRESTGWVPDICWRKFRDDMVWGREWWVSLCRAHPTELSICVPPPARGRTGGGLSDVASCTFGRTGFRHPGIPTTGPSRSQSAAGAVALRLGRKRLRNGALPPAAPDRLRREIANALRSPRSRPKRKRRAGRGLSREIVPLARFLILDSPTCFH